MEVDVNVALVQGSTKKHNQKVEPESKVGSGKDEYMQHESKHGKDSRNLQGTKCAYCACITSKLPEKHYKECNLKIRFSYIVCSYGKQWKQVLTED